MSKKIDQEIDQLYQLPLEEFTAARNSLAKEAGSESAGIKALSKPPLPAWAVNQLYWSRRDDYDRLIDAAVEMRKTHKSVIEGGRGDLRAAGREHELALDKALKATLALLEERGQAVTDATRQAILNTLRALPADEAAGRLSRALAPGGFEMLAGVKAAAPRGRQAGSKAATKQPPEASRAKERDTQRAAEERRAREAAERAVRDAEHRARQAEFETARTARDHAKAQKRLEDAQTALDEARTEAAAAERAARDAERAKETAERKTRDAEAALEAAKRALARD